MIDSAVLSRNDHQKMKLRSITQNSPSIRMLINKICMAFSGLLYPRNVLSVIKESAAAAVLSWKHKKFWILWKIDFPVFSASINGAGANMCPHTFFDSGKNSTKVVVN